MRFAADPTSKARRRNGAGATPPSHRTGGVFDVNFVSRMAVRRKGDKGQRLLRSYGPEFEQSIREMDMIAVREFGYKACEHIKRSQAVATFAIAHVRKNPDIEEETIEMSPHVRAMAAFILFHTMTRSDSYNGASEIAAQWGIKNGYSNWQINLAAEWALMRRLISARAHCEGAESIRYK